MRDIRKKISDLIFTAVNRQIVGYRVLGTEILGDGLIRVVASPRSPGSEGFLYYRIKITRETYATRKKMPL